MYFQCVQPFVGLPLEPFQRGLPVVAQVEVVEPHAGTEVDQRESPFTLAPCRIGVPQKQRVDDARILPEESFEVENQRIVFGRFRTDTV